ncbi:MAG TPA: hypothetical protein VFJ90_08450 [Candidatus Didemnitutus sp.]|nr:hypothetical protein [Candidatus Didemnitutus sp.]
MRGLTAAEALELWERGSGESPVRRALLLLAPVCPDLGPAALERLPLGERDALLLDLRERTFGSALSSTTACPACGGQVQADFTTRSIRAPRKNRKENWELDHQGVTARFRLLDSLDLEAVTQAADEESARRALLGRCLATAGGTRGDTPDVSEFSDAFVTALATRLADADPQADVSLALDCPGCGHRWDAPFDIAGFFWIELQSYARRLLQEIHELASAYGWTEAQILALTPARRAAYLELVHG